ncbi:MAG: hypothetical protein HOK42_05975 [Candidatus Marinimicrobia bacterium]|nr:hypothetical protein [Candidatus Neomarinimicrobiota bacterium]
MKEYRRGQVLNAAIQIILVLVLISCPKSPTDPEDIVEVDPREIVVTVFPDIGTNATHFKPNVYIVADSDTIQIGENYQIRCDYDGDGVADTEWLDTIPRTPLYSTHGKHRLSIEIQHSTGSVDNAYCEIYVQNLIEVTPPNISGEYENNIDWSRDGTNRIAYDAYGGELGANQSIFVMDYPSGTPIKISSSPNPGEYFFDQFPEWSPDGDKIVCSSSNGLDLITVGNGHRTTLIAEAGSTMKSWSPDGRWLIYWGGSGGRGATYVYDFDTDSSLPLFENMGYAAWSPDGTQIAISEMVGPDQAGSFFKIIDFASGDTLAAIQISNPGDKLDWSPDGKWISMGFDNKKVLSLFHIETGKILTFQPDPLTWCWWPSWSEDGTILAFEGQEAGGGVHLSIWAIEFPVEL